MDRGTVGSLALPLELRFSRVPQRAVPTPPAAPGPCPSPARAGPPGSEQLAAPCHSEVNGSRTATHEPQVTSLPPFGGQRCTKRVKLARRGPAGTCLSATH